MKMNTVHTEKAIQRKLSGKYSELYPIYLKLRDEIFKFGENIKIILFTIYLRIDFGNDTFAVLFYRNGYLELGLPTKKVHERLECGNHLKWEQINKVIKLYSVEDIDDFVINLLKEINSNRV